MMYSDKKAIYLASPLGFSQAGKVFMYEKLIPIIHEAGFKVIDPWVLTSEEHFDEVNTLPYGLERRQRWSGINKIIGQNNANAIEQADGLFAVLDGTDVDSGTASEIGFASALGKPMIGYRSDIRFAGDNEGSLVNLQVEYFLLRNGGRIVTDWLDIKPALLEVIGDRRI